jgi:hypothetical protein
LPTLLVVPGGRRPLENSIGWLALPQSRIAHL